jgi:hypothetical protein
MGDQSVARAPLLFPCSAIFQRLESPTLSLPNVSSLDSDQIERDVGRYSSNFQAFDGGTDYG